MHDFTEKCQTVTEAVEVAEDEQVAMLHQAVLLDEQISALYRDNQQLSPQAQICM